MAQTIKLRRSASQGAVPTTAQLALGEIAINTYDGKVYLKKDDGSESIVTIRQISDTDDVSEGSSNLYYTDSRARIAVGAVTKDMTGFENRSTSSLSFNPATRVLTLTPDSATYVYYRGEKIQISSAKSITITNTSGGRYIKFDPDTETLVENSIGAHPSIANDLLVSYVYWDAANTKAIIFGDERHDSARDTQWHTSQHLEVGAVWCSGGSLTYTTNDDSAVGLAVATPLVIADEDLVHTITHNSSATGQYEQILNGSAAVPVVYLNGTTYTESAAATMPWLYGASRAYYNNVDNGTGSLVQLASGKYVSYWMVATNDSALPVKLIMGHVQHDNENEAEAETFDNYGLPMPEVAPLYKIVLQADDTYTGNSAKVRIISVNTLFGRQSSLSASFSATSHNSLSERSASNQHPIAAITNLQTTLDAKLNTANLVSTLVTVDGSGTGIDSDLLDGQHGSYYTNYNNFTNTPTSLTDFTNDMWEVTATAPTDGTGKPTGYVWYVI